MFGSVLHVRHDRIAVRLFVLLFATLWIRSAEAQDVPPTEPSSAVADVRFAINPDSRFGSRTYVPEKWGELHLNLENRGATEQNLLCTSYFAGQPTLQFGRQVWLPPHSRLSISHPVLLPKADQLASNSAVVNSLVIDRTGGNEVLLKNDSGQLKHERSLLITPTDRNTGVVAGWTPSDIVPQDLLDLVIAARVGQALNNKVTILADQFLPADETSLSYLDHLVIADDRLLDDFAALAAVRRWLAAGGRLWVMLDRCNPVILERLLGDDFHGHVVDRVGLTTVRVDKAPSLVLPDGEPGETVDYDEPVDFARMAVSGMKVWNTVDGWPAAMTRSCGEGRILITTLGPRAWIKPTSTVGPVDKKATPATTSPFTSRSPMEDLSAYVLAQRAPDALPQTALQPLAEELVSYQVPKWSLIVGVMGAFLVSLIVIGVWLWRIERLERFGWIGSLLAVLFGIALTGIGMANRHSIPESLSSLQLAQSVSGTDDVSTHGMLAVYRPEESQSPVQATAGGRLWPELTAAEGATHRLVTTDLGTFEWEGLVQPAGLQMYADRTARTIPERLLARATINDQGVVGTFVGQSATAGDTILATRHGRMGVDLAADGQFTAAASNVFTPDQYLSATLLGDAQDRRRRILQQLFENQAWKQSLEQPKLLLWLNNWELGFKFGDGLQNQGETLLTVPLELMRPPAGTELLIPSPLLSFATCRPPDGSPPAGFWDDDRYEWQERSGASATWLQFQVPRALLPLKSQKGRLTVKVSGPMGRLDIMSVKDGAAVTLETVENPVGTLEFELNDPDVLAVNRNGELTLGVSADVTANLSDGQARGTANYWRIESLALQLWAVTTEPEKVD